jgi:hypothetical protein
MLCAMLRNVRIALVLPQSLKIISIALAHAVALYVTLAHHSNHITELTRYRYRLCICSDFIRNVGYYNRY